METVVQTFITLLLSLTSILWPWITYSPLISYLIPITTVAWVFTPHLLCCKLNHEKSIQGREPSRLGACLCRVIRIRQGRGAELHPWLSNGFLRSEFEEIDAFNLIWTMDCEHMCQNIIVLHQIRERKGKRTEDTQVHTCILRLAIWSPIPSLAQEDLSNRRKKNSVAHMILMFPSCEPK